MVITTIKWMSGRMKEYLMNAPFCQILGKRARTGIIMFFLAHPDFEYKQFEIAKNVGLTRQTVASELKPLVRFGLLKKNDDMYSVDTESVIYIRLVEFNRQLVKHEVQVKQEA